MTPKQIADELQYLHRRITSMAQALDALQRKMKNLEAWSEQMDHGFREA